MAQGIFGTKVGMTQIFAEDGTSIPVTVVRVKPGTVVGKCTLEKQGYSAIRVGFLPRAEKKMNKPEMGLFKKAGVSPMNIIREFRLSPEEVEKHNVGDVIKMELFRKGQFVDVTGISKGHGFAGVIKRWGMKGTARDASTAHEHHRHIGAIGARKTPGKVWKGHHMPGHFGVDRITIQNLQVVELDLENELMLIRGAVPGHKESLLEIFPCIKGKADRPVVPAHDEVDDKKKGKPKK